MRISRHQMFMEMAHVVAKRATCFRENVGCIIVQNNNIIAIGYNGAPPGMDHCTYHPNGKCDLSIHAEVNALSQIEHLTANKDCDLYVTHLPCLDCTAEIIKSNHIKSVYFHTIYGSSDLQYSMFDSGLIKLLRVLPSGDITSHDRSEKYDEVK